MSGSSLYLGEVMHQRLRQPGYRFSYRVFSLYLDLDELSSLPRRLRFFSHNRFNLFSLHDRDHGPRDGSALRPWLERLLAGRGIALDGGSIHLLCFPRVLGYVFNPLCVWYCRHRDGSLRAVVCEVRNTFGGMHHYVLAAGGRPMHWRAEYRARKVFHVSPFIQPQAEYRFRFQEPGERLRVSIDVSAVGGPLLRTSIGGARQPLMDSRLMRMFLRVPFMTFKIIAMIHWQALKIWLRGGRFHRMPETGRYQGSEQVTEGWTARPR